MSLIDKKELSNNKRVGRKMEIGILDFSGRGMEEEEGEGKVQGSMKLDRRRSERVGESAECHSKWSGRRQTRFYSRLYASYQRRNHPFSFVTNSFYKRENA